jgi:hypothetical protein
VTYDLISLRRVGTVYWIRLAAGWGIQPEHSWVVPGTVRKDTMTLFGVGLVLIRMSAEQ